MIYSLMMNTDIGILVSYMADKLPRRNCSWDFKLKGWWLTSNNVKINFTKNRQIAYEWTFRKEGKKCQERHKNAIPSPDNARKVGVNDKIKALIQDRTLKLCAKCGTDVNQGCECYDFLDKKKKGVD